MKETYKKVKLMQQALADSLTAEVNKRLLWLRGSVM